MPPFCKLVTLLSHLLLLSTNPFTQVSVDAAPDTPERSWVQLGDTIPYLGGAKDSYLLSSSDDGKIVAVSEKANFLRNGYIGVYHYLDDVQEWRLSGNIPEVGDGDVIFNLDLSDDGNVLAVSANDQEGQAFVRIYQYDTLFGFWERIGADIISSNGSREADLSVSISRTGNIVAVGSAIGQMSPAVRVYRFSAEDEGSWQIIGKPILGDGNNDEFGMAVDILDYGGDIYLAVGAPAANENRGDVTVYKCAIGGNTWRMFGDQMVEGDETGAVLGASISLAHDGSTLLLAVGFPSYSRNERSGVRVYSISSLTGQWDYYGQMIYGEEANDQTGLSIALSRDGQTLAVGSPGYERNAGMIRVFYKGTHREEYTKVGYDFYGEPDENLGRSVTLSKDGKTIIMGSKIKDIQAYKMKDPSLFSNTGDATRIIAISFIVISVVALCMVVSVKVSRRFKSRGTSASFAPVSMASPRQDHSYEIGNQISEDEEEIAHII